MFGRNISDSDNEYLKVALDHAKQSGYQGGVPAGAVLVGNGRVVGGGRNRKVQEGDRNAHAVIDCLKGCESLETYGEVSLYTTSSPCTMCAAAIVETGVSRVVIGDSFNFKGAPAFMREKGVEVVEMNDPECIQMLETFIRHHPGIWDEPLPPHLAG